MVHTEGSCLIWVGVEFQGKGVETWYPRIPTMHTESGLWTERKHINVYILQSFQKPVHHYCEK